MKASFLWACVSSLTELQIKVSQGWGMYRRSLQHWFSSLQHDCPFPCLLLSRFFPPKSWFLRWCLMLEPLSVWLIFVVGEGHACTDKQTGFCSWHVSEDGHWMVSEGLKITSTKGNAGVTSNYWLLYHQNQVGAPQPQQHSGSHADTNSSTASRHCSSWAPATSQQHLFQNKGPSSCLK